MEEDPPSIKHSTYLQVLAKHYAGAKKFTSVVPRPYKGQQRAQATAEAILERRYKSSKVNFTIAHAQRGCRIYSLRKPLPAAGSIATALKKLLEFYGPAKHG